MVVCILFVRVLLILVFPKWQYLSKNVVIYLLTPRFKRALCPVPKDCSTSLSRPHRFFGLSAQHHAILFCASDAFKPLTFKSFLTDSSRVFLGRTLGLLPVTIVLSAFLGHVSGSIHWRWPYQRRRLRLRTFSVPHRPNQLLSSSDGILSASFVE